jgi:hypothetical protein
MQLLRTMFLSTLISHFGDIAPTCLPDLAAYFLWDYVKSKVYEY